MHVKHSVLALLILLLVAGYAARSCGADPDASIPASAQRSNPAHVNAPWEPAPAPPEDTAAAPIDERALIPPKATPGAEPGAAPASVTAGELQRYAALAAGTQPADRYAAYKMLLACERLRQMTANIAQMSRSTLDTGEYLEIVEQNNAQTRKLCTGLPHADTRIRLGLLRDAVAGGIRSALLDLYTEGPNGEPLDLWHRPDDLNVQHWFTTTTAAIAEQARRGDIESAYLLSSIYDAHSGITAFTDPDKAALYGALGWELLKRSKPMPDGMRAMRERVANAGLEKLPAERAAAIKREVAEILAKL